jgi:hypothetical protein
MHPTIQNSTFTIQNLFHLFVGRVLATKPTVLFPLQAIRIVFLVLGRRVISPLAFLAGQVDDLTHLSTPRHLSRGTVLLTPGFP